MKLFGETILTFVVMVLALLAVNGGYIRYDNNNLHIGPPPQNTWCNGITGQCQPGDPPSSWQQPMPDFDLPPMPPERDMMPRHHDPRAIPNKCRQPGKGWHWDQRDICI
ncbi:MAG: hypothetical protein V4474_03040 [Patescibacteria group bacterium]